MSVLIIVLSKDAVKIIVFVTLCKLFMQLSCICYL